MLPVLSSVVLHAPGRAPGRAPARSSWWRPAIALLLASALASAGCRSCREPDGRELPGRDAAPGQGDAGAALPGEDGALLDRIDAALGRASGFLIAHQGEDGAFRSSAYAAFKDGYSLAPLVLTALLFVPRSGPDAGAPAPDGAAIDAAYRKGVDFVGTLVTEDGSLRAGIDGPRYPTYSIAGAILVLNVPDNGRHARAREALVDILRERQLMEHNGWTPADASYGGWGYFHAVPRKDAGHDPALSANLSATLFAIGALRLGGVPADDPALQAARVFVERCQNMAPGDGGGNGSGGGNRMSGSHGGDDGYDGGFFFSPAVPDSNKAGALGPARAPEGADDGAGDGGLPRYRSYGSMTADGIRALLQLGLPFDHARVQAAAAWLERRYTPARNPGDFPPEAEIRRESAYFYYTWSSAHALRALGKRELATENGALRWPEALAAELLQRQRADGSWANAYSEMREDDPMVATSFAVAALAIARMVLRGEHRVHSIHRAPAQAPHEAPRQTP